MREPLENITIGNFLYGLGLTLGARAGNAAPYGCVNLLQQGPLDPPLGDVLFQFPSSVIRLFEFKRGSADKTKERAKHEALQKAIGKEENLQVVSRKVHWYVETHDREVDFHFGAKPYLDMQASVPELNMESLIKGLVDDIIEKRELASLEEVHEYIRTVTTLAGKAYRKYSGLLISVGSGGMAYVVVDDLRDLRRNGKELNHLMELQYRRTLELTGMEHTMERKIEAELKYEHSGLSLGLG